MTDRELLELAAKIAGIDAEWDEYCKCMWLEHPTESSTCYSWNPLKFDGDALRLAVKLGMMAKDSLAFDLMQDFMDWGALDMTSATRRAITRAAAQMQLNKEQANGK